MFRHTESLTSKAPADTILTLGSDLILLLILLKTKVWWVTANWLLSCRNLYFSYSGETEFFSISSAQIWPFIRMLPPLIVGINYRILFYFIILFSFCSYNLELLHLYIVWLFPDFWITAPLLWRIYKITALVLFSSEVGVMSCLLCISRSSTRSVFE